jgi:hypothetical protein
MVPGCISTRYKCDLYWVGPSPGTNGGATFVPNNPTTWYMPCSLLPPLLFSKSPPHSPLLFYSAFPLPHSFSPVLISFLLSSHISLDLLTGGGAGRCDAGSLVVTWRSPARRPQARRRGSVVGRLASRRGGAARWGTRRGHSLTTERGRSGLPAWRARVEPTLPARGQVTAASLAGAARDQRGDARCRRDLGGKSVRCEFLCSCES